MTMKIKRVINGVEMEIELTDNEVYTAYQKQKLVNEISDIDCLYGDVFTDEEMMDIAEEARSLRENGGMMWDNAIHEAVEKLGLTDKAEGNDEGDS